MSGSTSRWRSNGVRIIRAGELSSNTPQTPGMQRRAAVTPEATGATKLWAGTVTIQPKAKTGAHHHGDLESVIYVVNGIARLRWGESLEFVAEAEAGDQGRRMAGVRCRWSADRALRPTARPPAREGRS